ncbi:hypothetical protein ACWGQ5_15770 [Streptomyces sp. NPDC055722]
MEIVSNGDDAGQREKIAPMGLDARVPTKRIVVRDGTAVLHEPNPAALRAPRSRPADHRREQAA